MSDRHDLPDRLAALSAELAAVKADNARLRRLLDAQGVPDRLRHAFRDTVAMLRAIMRRTAETARDVESYNGHLASRLDAIVRARALTDAFGEADLHTIVSGELDAYLLREGEQATLDGPEVRLRPKAAEVLTLAMHELATNAVEHGPLGGPAGHVRVTWRVEPGEAVPILVLAWKEAGATEAFAPGRRGFGTAVLEEMLAYDLGARTVLLFEPDGLCCTIRLPLTGRVGGLVEQDAAAAP